MKNIVIFSDGTGQRGGLSFDERRTNIYKLFRATRCGPDSSVNPLEQLTFYDPGLGTLPPGHAGLTSNIIHVFLNVVSQATGVGITRNIIDCYSAVVQLWRPGDRIFLFGFSRGAYTVRCLAAVISLCGVPTRDNNGELKRNESTCRRIASEAVKKVYQHTESRKMVPDERHRELLAQREELAHRFRAKYGSASSVVPEKANVYPHFVGVFDAVASLARPILTTFVYTAAILLLAFMISWLFHFLGIHLEFWKWIAPAVLIAALLLLAFKMARSEIGLTRKNRCKLFHFTKPRKELYETDLRNEVGCARHALSIDEHRASFPRVEWGGAYSDSKGESGWFEQVWFAGNHSDVGGSYPENESRLSDISLQWMLEAATTEGLKYDRSFLQLFPDPAGPQHDETRRGVFRIARKQPRRVPDGAILHPSVLKRFEAANVLDYDTVRPYRPENLSNHKDVKAYYSNILS